eukprot:scaffold3277_cov269-Prasinococcus_capsulatus_cf.AAC.1
MATTRGAALRASGSGTQHAPGVKYAPPRAPRRRYPAAARRRIAIARRASRRRAGAESTCGLPYPQRRVHGA